MIFRKGLFQNNVLNRPRWLVLKHLNTAVFSSNFLVAGLYVALWDISHFKICRWIIAFSLVLTYVQLELVYIDGVTVALFSFSII